jgi:hypothetical protein
MNNGVIDDKTAARYYDELDTLTGQERKSRADALRLWADQKDAEQKREQLDTLKKIYSNFDGYVKEAGLQDFDEDSRYRTANRQFIASQFDQTPEEQKDIYSSLRDKWTESVAGKKGMSEKETFDLIRRHLLGIGKATKSKVEIIDDATATRIYNEIDNATGDERQQMADALLTWGEKKAKEEYNQADEHFSNLFLDEQYYAEQVNAPDIYQVYQAYKAIPFPEEAAKRAVLQAYLQHASGAPVSADTYETIRDSYAQAKFGKSPVSDDEMFDLIRGQYETQMIQRAKQAFQIGLKKLNQPNS